MVLQYITIQTQLVPVLGQADTVSGNGPAIYHSVDTVGPVLGQADTGSGNGPAIYYNVDTVGPILGQADTGSGNGPAIYHNVDTVQCAPYWVRLIQLVAMVLQYITM